MRKKYLLFDLDGTLTDPKLGITSCVQYALKFFDIEEPDNDKLLSYIGPPLIESFQEYHGLTQEQAKTAVEKYRERFKDIGIFENDVIDGIDEVLSEFMKKGFVLALATSKPQEFAVRIMEHFDLSRYFTVEMGSGMNGERKYKADVIEAVIERLAKMYPQEDISSIKADSIMIGDRLHDIEGAKQCGIESIGVRFGYAKEGELEEAGDDYIVSTPQELLKLLTEE